MSTNPQDRPAREKAFAALDRPEVLQFVFYPRRDVSDAPAGARDYAVRVSGGIDIGCRFHVHSRLSPSVLLFHGNGEVVCDYDEVGPIYTKMGANLMVADYRGYGSSGGTPGFASMAADAHSIFKGFLKLLGKEACDRIFVLGRSLGSVSAVELALSYPEEVKGLIIDSGFGSMLRLFRHLGFPRSFLGAGSADFPNLSAVRSIRQPTLIIHGECDMLVPVSEAKALHENSAAADKRLVVIPGAGHNDIMMTGAGRYFGPIRDFIRGGGGVAPAP